MSEEENALVLILQKILIEIKALKISHQELVKCLETKDPDLEYHVQETFKKAPVKKRSAKKIEPGKVYNYKYKDGNERRCNKCDGLISFDDYNKETHPYPTHVDEEGHIIGDGSCPLYTIETIERGK